MRYLLLLTILTGTLLLGQPALAEDFGLGETAGTAGYDTGARDPSGMIGQIIGFFLGFLGVAFLILALYAGILWMTAGGNEEQVTKARKWLINSVIGIIIILAAYALSTFVIQGIINATSQT